MRYFHAPALERIESAYLRSDHGKSYAPHGEVRVGPRVVVSTPPLDYLDLDGERLVIEPETTSWAFVDPFEHELLQRLAIPRTVADLAAGSPRPIEGLLGELFRRGLVALDGQRSLAPDLHEHSANTTTPHLVELLVTEKCNLACGYCLAGATPKMPAMSPQVAQRAVDLAFDMDEAADFAFEMSGGEPFLQFPLMQELVTYIRAHPKRRGRPVALSIQTNATLLDDARVEWVKREGITLGVSLDGDPASHNVSRPQVNGKESFTKVIRGLDLLQRARVPFGVLVVLNRANVSRMHELVDFLVDNGIAAVKINPIAYLGTGRERWGDLGLEQHEVIAYFQAFLGRVLELRHDLLEATLGTMCQYLVSKQRSNRCMRGHCGAGVDFQVVSAKGDIYPCGRATQSPGLKLGHVDEALVSLSAAGRRAPVIHEILARRPRDVGCASCPVRQWCQAGCAAQAYERYGSVRHKTPECDFFKTMYPYLLRRLTFDHRALEHLARSDYFGVAVEPVSSDLGVARV